MKGEDGRIIRTFDERSSLPVISPPDVCRIKNSADNTKALATPVKPKMNRDQSRSMMKLSTSQLEVHEKTPGPKKSQKVRFELPELGAKEAYHENRHGGGGVFKIN